MNYQNKLSKILTGVFLGAFILFHLFLISKTLRIDNYGSIRTAFAGYGDIPFHMTQVSKFAFGSMDLNEPIFTGDRIRYSFVINFFSGILLRISHSWVFSFHFPAMVFATFGIIFTFLFYKKMLKAKWMAGLALILFFLGSGLGAYSYVKDNFFGGNLSIKEFSQYLTDHNISTINKLDAKYPQQNVVWGAPLSLVFLHQRSFFGGFFVVALLAYLLSRTKALEKRKTIVFSAVLFGALPLIHYHSFLVVFIVLVLMGARFFLKKNQKLFKRTVLIILFGFIIALPQIIYLTAGKNNIVFSGAGSFINFRLGWMAEPTIGSVQYPATGLTVSVIEKVEAYSKFLWVNFGVVLPLFLVAFLVLFLFRKKKENSDILFLAITAGLLFLFVQTVRVQPWDYDSNKILVYFQFFAAPVIVWLFNLMIEKNKAIGIVATISLFSLSIFSGVADLTPRFLVKEENMPVIFDNGAVQLADFVKSNIKEGDLILTSSTHLNPVSSLAGRPVLVGYPGWLWTKGIDYSEREFAAKTFYRNPAENKNIFDSFDFKYVLLDNQAVNDWGARKSVFDARFLKVFESGNYALYKL